MEALVGSKSSLEDSSRSLELALVFMTGGRGMEHGAQSMGPIQASHKHPDHSRSISLHNDSQYAKQP